MYIKEDIKEKELIDKLYQIKKLKFEKFHVDKFIKNYQMHNKTGKNDADNDKKEPVDSKKNVISSLISESCCGV